jgi:DNA-binding MarR family transcriptional regulator
MSSPSFIRQVRSFNRAVTLFTGALNDSYLGRGRPLGQARLLFEIEREGSDIGSLRERLGLDSGYASRLLRALEAEGLISVEADEADRRRRLAKLTVKGAAEREAYDALSDDLARSLLGSLSSSQQERLVAAMREVERLTAAASIVIAAEPDDSPDAIACVQAYYDELNARFDGGFDPGSGGYAGHALPGEESGTFMIARLHGRAVGCGALMPLDAQTGEIKRMWIAPGTRGIGLSHRLLQALEGEARRRGLARVVLDTNRSLAEAQSLYRKAGYREIPRYNDNAYADFWFEKEIGQAAPPAVGVQPGKSSPISR